MLQFSIPLYLKYVHAAKYGLLYSSFNYVSKCSLGQNNVHVLNAALASHRCMVHTISERIFFDLTLKLHQDFIGNLEKLKYSLYDIPMFAIGTSSMCN